MGHMKERIVVQLRWFAIIATVLGAFTAVFGVAVRTLPSFAASFDFQTELRAACTVDIGCKAAYAFPDRDPKTGKVFLTIRVSPSPGEARMASVMNRQIDAAKERAADNGSFLLRTFRKNARIEVLPK
jgi:hypothetical protein